MSRYIPIPFPVAPELLDRINAKLSPLSEDKCWEWQGTRVPNGYAVISIKNRAFRVTRLLLSHKIGRPLADNEVACHKCDNPPCCNPAHLFVGTQSDNILDAIKKKRFAPDMSAAQQSFRDRPTCPYGHPYSGDNLYINPTRGTRGCYACRREAGRIRTAAKTAARRARAALENRHAD